METKGILTYEEDTCRICMTHQSGVIDINSSVSTRSARIIDMIRFCFDIELVIHEALPNFICNECALHLNVAYNLKGKCLQTEKFFLNYLNVETDSKSNLLSMLHPLSPPASEVPDNYEQKILPSEDAMSSITQDKNNSANNDANDDTADQIKYIRPNLMAYFGQDTLIELSDTDSDTDDESNISTPVVSATNSKNHECPTCSERFPDLFHFNNHVKEHEKKVCKICSRVCANYLNLIHHFRTHRPDLKIKCLHCNFTCASRFALYSHVRYNHGDGNNVKDDAQKTSIKCRICTKEFDKLDNFGKHIREDHKKPVQTNVEAKKYGSFTTIISPLKCKECSRHFKNYRTYSVHMKLHEKSKLQFCYVCRLSFKHNMHMHFKICHPGMAPYKCMDHCNQTFTNQKAFLAHEKIAKLNADKTMCVEQVAKKARYSLPTDQNRSNVNIPPVGYSFVPLDQTETFDCYICDVKVDSEALLAEHIASHDEKKCKMCARTFGNVRALSGHFKLKHPKADDKNSYACGECGKSYSSYSSLKHHQYLHKTLTNDTQSSISILRESEPETIISDNI